MEDLVNNCEVIEMEIPASLSSGKRRKVDSQSPENSSSASSISLDPNKKVEDLETDFSSFEFEDFSEEKAPLKEEETEASSLTMKLTALSSGASFEGKMLTPSEAEIEEFFCAAEKYEQKRFSEKYNYDIVKDVPLEGRYQWVKL